MFGVFRGSLVLGDKSEYVVAAPQYRAASNTAMGWKNSNLRTEMKRLLRHFEPGACLPAKSLRSNAKQSNQRRTSNLRLTSRSIFDFLSLYVASTISSSISSTPSANRCPNTNRWFLGKLSTWPSTHLVESYHFTSTTGWVAATCHCFPMPKVQRFKYPTKSHA